MTKKLDVTQGDIRGTMSDHTSLRRNEPRTKRTERVYHSVLWNTVVDRDALSIPSSPSATMTADFEKLHPSDRPVIRTTCYEPRG